MQPICRFGVIGDVHGNGALLARILLEYQTMPLAFILCVGDISPNLQVGKRASGTILLETLTRQTQALMDTFLLAQKDVCFVLGNHDDRARWRERIKVRKGIHNVDSRAAGKPYAGGGAVVAGMGGSPRTPEYWPNEWLIDTTATLRALQRNWVASPCRILLAHCPPKGTFLDIGTHRTAHLGSKAIRGIMKALKPLPSIGIFGHIHESRGVDIVEGITCLNAGSLASSLHAAGDSPAGMLYGASGYCVSLYDGFSEIVELFVPTSLSFPAITRARYIIEDRIIQVTDWSGCNSIDTTDSSPPKPVRYMEIMPRGSYHRILGKQGQDNLFPQEGLSDVSSTSKKHNL
jgi:Icc-related predicted phosphoesterase